MTTRPNLRSVSAALAALAAGALLASGCAKHEHTTPSPEVVVVTAPVDSAKDAPAVFVSGLLAGKEEAPLAFKIGGVIARIDVEAGQAVRAGQRLAALEPAEIGSAVEKASAAVEKADRDWERARALYADSVVTKQLFDDAGTARAVAHSDLRAARFNERYASIVAPAAGTVLHRLAEPGQTVGPGMPIVVFSAAGRGQVVRAGLADRDAPRVAIGDRASVTFSALPGRTWSGRVTRVGAAATPGVGTVEVEVALEEPVRLSDDGALASGLVADVAITPARPGTVRRVPVAALVEGDGDRAHVWTLAADGRPVRRDVRLAYMDGDRVAIASGLDGVARVVVDGAAYLSADSRVREVAR